MKFRDIYNYSEASRKVWLEVSDDLEISEFATNLPNSYQTKIHQLLEKIQKFGFIKQREERVFQSLAKESL